VAPYNNSFETLVKDLKNYHKKGYRVLLLSGSRTRAKRLAEDLRDNELRAVYSEDPMREVLAGEVLTCYGHVSRGFEYPMLKFVVLSETDIFGAEKKKKKKKKQYRGQKINDYLHSLIQQKLKNPFNDVPEFMIGGFRVSVQLGKSQDEIVFVMKGESPAAYKTTAGQSDKQDNCQRLMNLLDGGIVKDAEKVSDAITKLQTDLEQAKARVNTPVAYEQRLADAVHFRMCNGIPPAVSKLLGFSPVAICPTQ